MNQLSNNAVECNLFNFSLVAWRFIGDNPNCFYLLFRKDETCMELSGPNSEANSVPEAGWSSNSSSIMFSEHSATKVFVVRLSSDCRRTFAGTFGQNIHLPLCSLEFRCNWLPIGNFLAQQNSSTLSLTSSYTDAVFFFVLIKPSLLCVFGPRRYLYGPSHYYLPHLE